MNAGDVEQLFTRGDGQFAFARWGRAIAPVVFGVEDETLSVIKRAIDAVCQLAGHEMSDGDAELGANFMWFFFREWDELLAVPRLDDMIPDLGPLVGRLKGGKANQYRLFRFDKLGAIKACFVFVRMDDHLAAVSADALVLSQVTQSILLWSDVAFKIQSPLALVGETTVLRPEIGHLIRAAYDRVMPASSQDPTHALRLSARIEMMQ
ncbi:MAG: hypothetical protein ACI82I_003502 [Gammaproteobacteria bacterium]|jgi:hypothetical protein